MPIDHASVSTTQQRMFPDSEIAKQFSLGKDKMSYLINFGLAPYFKTKLALLKTREEEMAQFAAWILKILKFYIN